MSNLPATCPRCAGAMMPTQHDLYGEYRECLSCGYHADRLVEPHIDQTPKRIGGRVGVRPKRKRAPGG